jgi:hypothetical protein
VETSQHQVDRDRMPGCYSYAEACRIMRVTGPLATAAVREGILEAALPEGATNPRAGLISQAAIDRFRRSYALTREVALPGISQSRAKVQRLLQLGLVPAILRPSRVTYLWDRVAVEQKIGRPTDFIPPL